MKITVMCPKSEFSKSQQDKLVKLGEIIYTENREEYSLEKLVGISKDSEILAFDPDNIGGFEVAPERLVKLMDAMPKIKGLALSTTAFGYIDYGYCKKRGIVVTNVPYYSTESVAEHALALMLGCAKRIFLTDRRTQNDKYQLEMGYELKGKTLGVIGLGHIGTRTAELGLAVGMKVIGWNRTPKKVKSVEAKSLDEQAMAEALKSGKVDTYALEAEDLTSPPLGGIENAILFKGFGWFTKEALERNKQIWVDNIIGIAQGKPINPVSS